MNQKPPSYDDAWNAPNQPYTAVDLPNPTALPPIYNSKQCQCQKKRLSCGRRAFFGVICFVAFFALAGLIGWGINLYMKSQERY
ncbi:unnamed protein product, partial [Mesorhabditis belari]|uniref:Uncharacterized protein n=1 Tax=Mesorhabditis belari TaxID=2138241 RepID=A0AAF3FLM6_9BILA